mgnify:CR=1 FL=1
MNMLAALWRKVSRGGTPSRGPAGLSGAARAGRWPVVALVAVVLAMAGLVAMPSGAGAKEVAVPAARITVEGAANFRDLGGIATADGRRIRPGMLFRSDNLSNLTGRDWQTLVGTGVGLIVDFRSEQEVAAAPPTQPDKIERLALPIGLANVDFAVMYKQIMDGQLDAIEIPDSYGRIALDASDQYRRWFARLVDGGGQPSVFHCSSGKDRTGFAAAMLMSALGVPWETVLREFVASNHYLHDRIERTVARIRQRGPVDEQKLRALLGVRQLQMENTLRVIEARHGSLERYLEAELGLDAAARERLRQLYLE